MGLLRAEATGALITLTARHLAGRSPACALVVADPRVSSEHAVIAWRGDGWVVRDLGSRNGTFLEGRQLQTGAEAQLHRGHRLVLGENAGFVLEHDGPPVPMAVNLEDGASVSGVGDVLSLPDEEAPRASVFRGADGAWVIEESAGRPVVDLEVVVIGGARWRLYLPTLISPTVAAAAAPALQFDVTSDEERVTVHVASGGRTVTLPSRSHHYLLLTLARLRRSEAEQPASERGWITREALARALRCDPTTVNVQLHRLRQDLGREGVEGAAALLEVRARSGQVRVGTDRITIVRP